MSRATNQSEIVNIRFRGLVTQPNELSVTQGGLKIAENVNVDKDNLVESRRGGKVFGTSLTADVNKMFVWKDKLLLHHGTTLARDSDDAGTWSAYSGSVVPPAGNRVHSTQANRNFYFTTTEGIKKLDALAGAISSAGMPKGLDLNLTLTLTGASLANNTAVAYRVVWAFTDANNNLLLGAPSQRVEISNTSGISKNVTLNFSVPSEITTAHKYQVYRSKAVPVISAGGPSDELQLAFDGSPSAGDIAAKFVSVTDATIEAALTADLYTNSSQEGIAQTNDTPPLATDLATYKNHTFYANTQNKQKGTINLLAVGPTLGIQVGDTLTIGAVTITGSMIENSAAGQFLVSTLLTPADAIEETALSIVKTINRFTTNTTLVAYYGSGVDDPPGAIIVEGRIFSSTPFFFTTSRPSAFTPVLTGTLAPSSDNRKLNRIYISKLSRPEAVPAGNFLDAGSADKEILRILPLKDALFILKQDGVYVITGDTASTFRAREHDPTIFIRGRETAVVINNRVMTMSNQGVVSIDENGVTVKSREREDVILPYNSPLFANFESIAHAVGYESDRKYLLFVPTVYADAVPTIVHAYNVFTEAWTTWPLSRTAGIVNTRDDKLYLASPTNNSVYQERKNFTLYDHADDEFSVTITSSSGALVNMSSTAAVIAGQTLKQGFREAVVLEVISGTQIKVPHAEAWVAGAAAVFNPIPCKIRWKVEDAKHPELVKQFNDVQLFFRESAFAKLDVGFSTNFLKTEQVITLPSNTLSGWGEKPWGEEAWGGDPSDSLEIRTLTPEEASRGLWLTMSIATNQAFTRFAAAGCAVSMRPVSEKY